MAATRRDYYEVLGVPRDADARAIKNAFRRLARKYHPDRSTEPDAEERFKEIAEAYGVLADPAKRASYDAQGFSAVAGVPPDDLWAGIDFGDILGEAGFGAGLFERFFGRARPGPPRGADIETEVAVPLTRIATGGAETVTISRPGACAACSGSGAWPGTTPRPCPACGGTGERVAGSLRGHVIVRQVTACPDCAGRGTVIDQPCTGCGGTGQAVQKEQVTVGIPPGLPDATALRIPARGMPSPVAGGEPGDAFLIVRTEPDRRFIRRGHDLWHDLEVAVPDAVLGSTAAVPTLDGEIRITIPPGTQPGTVLRVTGKGLPRFRGTGRGSLYVNVAVHVPDPRRLSPGQRRLYEQLREQPAGTDDTGGGPRPKGWRRRGRRGPRHPRGEGRAAGS
ncbi:MAG TPA: DnaJ C-terminal domain-containing protein [Streptosporangiaceae bacterium]|nr:DnaJ C-terminal domain-containing protein [Streptosporangiaceae bacterium]